jgi:hypothetical protein
VGRISYLPGLAAWRLPIALALCVLVAGIIWFGHLGRLVFAAFTLTFLVSATLRGRTTRRNLEVANRARHRPLCTLRLRRVFRPLPIQTQITIRRPRGEVSAYAADPDNATAWYEKTKSVEWQTERPLAAGSKIAFAPLLELLAAPPSAKVVEDSHSGPIPLGRRSGRCSRRVVTEDG